jgi:hypothetical protein
MEGPVPELEAAHLALGHHASDLHSWQKKKLSFSSREAVSRVRSGKYRCQRAPGYSIKIHTPTFASRIFEPCRCSAIIVTWCEQLATPVNRQASRAGVASRSCWGGGPSKAPGLWCVVHLARRPTCVDFWGGAPVLTKAGGPPTAARVASRMWRAGKAHEQGKPVREEGQALVLSFERSSNICEGGINLNSSHFFSEATYTQRLCWQRPQSCPPLRQRDSGLGSDQQRACVRAASRMWRAGKARGHGKPARVLSAVRSMHNFQHF